MPRRPSQRRRPRGDTGELPGCSFPDRRRDEPGQEMGHRRGVRIGEGRLLLPRPHPGRFRQRPEVPRKQGRLRGRLLQDMVRRRREAVREEERLPHDLLHESGNHSRRGQLSCHNKPRLSRGRAVREVRGEALAQGRLRSRRPFLRVRPFQGDDRVREGGQR